MLHIEDPDFNEPLVVKQTSSSEKEFDATMISMITSMGFTENQSKKALNGKIRNKWQIIISRF